MKNLLLMVLCAAFLSLTAPVVLAVDIHDLRSDPQFLLQVQKTNNLDAAFGLSHKESLEELSGSVDRNGVTHTRYRQTFKDVPVWGEQVIISRSTGGKVLSLHGRLVQGLADELAYAIPSFSAKDALTAMEEETSNRRTTGAPLLFRNETSELVIYIDKGVPRLSYSVSFFADTETGGFPTRPVYLIDATSGLILFQYEGLTYATEGTGPGGNVKVGRYEYGTDFGYLNVDVDGTSCTMNNLEVKTVDLKHGTSGSTPYVYTCYENTHEAINEAYCPLNDAHYFGGVVYDMYNDWYGVPPLDFQLMMRVHYSTDYENAFWDGTSMTFGDGLTTFYPLVSLDVAAHEVSHGFTEQHSNLIYTSQSGGINEAFSDMAGEAAEFYLRGYNDWLAGADIYKDPDGALRYMCDPTRDNSSIDHASNYYSGLDVHYSSGVYNKAFCLLAQTKSGDDEWDVKKAFDVFVYANQYLWGPSENFESAYAAVRKAASNLGYSTEAVDDAFAAVGIPAGPVCTAEEATLLQNGVPSDAFSADTGYWTCFTLDVPVGATSLEFITTNVAKGRKRSIGDADLYTRLAEAPTGGAESGGVYDCGSYSSDSNESCIIDSPGAGRWFAAVHAWRAFPAVTVTGTYIGSAAPLPAGEITLTAQVKGGSRNTFVTLAWAGASGESVDVFKNSQFYKNTANDGSYKDPVGEAEDLYRVCLHESTESCSNEATAN